jgi:hypothetical protein
MTATASLEDRLRLSQEREAWRPAAGEQLVGTVLSITERESNYGGTYPLLVVATDDGRALDVHAFESVLLDELAKLRPRVGERIGIAYLGKHEERGYHRYRLVVDRDAQPSVDWDRYGEQAAADLADAGAAPTDVRIDARALDGLRDTFRRSGWTTERLGAELRALGVTDTSDVAAATRTLTRSQAARLAQAMALDRANLAETD